MNASRKMSILTGALLLLAGVAAHAADAPVELRRNPFERPAAAAAETAPVTGGGAKSVENPGLRAVLFAGSKSVVNFGGVIMQIGDRVNGYELLSVAEGAATFRNAGKTVVFSIYEPDRDDE